MKHVAAAVVAAAALVASGADLTFLPSESVLWSTVTEAAPSVSVFWPPEAASAKLVVKDGRQVTTNDVALGTTSVALPLARPDSPANERVVELTLCFYDSSDAECTLRRQTAKVAVPRLGTSTEPARYVQSENPNWGYVDGKTALLPVPDGADYEGAPCRWWFVSPVPTVPTEFSLPDLAGETLCSAILWRIAGLMLMVK